jgi:Uma2 family endonuclease
MDEVLTRRRFTVEEYHRMGEVGILPEDSRVELIAGDIVVREPIGSYHAGAVNRLTRLWTSMLGDRAVVQVQNPVELAKEDTELQPDVALLQPRADFYATSHPVAADVLLLIEVADTSLPRDRRVKVPLYARAGIREVWLVDLPSDRIEVYRDPTASGYGHVRALGRGESVACEAIPDLTVAVADLLG